MNLIISALSLQTQSSEQHTTNTSIPKKHSFQMAYSIGSEVNHEILTTDSFNIHIQTLCDREINRAAGKIIPGTQGDSANTSMQ
jgi:hypothetical protein